jgi:DNA polymerase-3 subunit delta
MAATKPSRSAPPASDAASAPVALIYGDDDFAVKQRGRQLYQQWCGELGGMDHETIDAQVNNSGEALKALGKLREALNTLPFFGGGKAIWFQNCNFLSDDRTSSSQAVSESVSDLAQELKTFAWQNVRLLVTTPKIDKRKAIYKTLEKIGAVEACEAWKLEDKDWAGQAEADMRRAFRARKKEITDEALAELIHFVGPHRQQLVSEVEKLCLFVGERGEIGVADVNAVVTRNKQARAFAVAEALGDRDLPRVLRTLDEELWEMQFDKVKSEIGLLYGLITKVRAMLFAQEMMREGWVKPDPDYFRFKNQLERVPADQLPTDKKFNPLSMHPFVLHKAVLQARRYTADELVRAIGLLLECNQRLVSSGLDEALVLQQTLVQIIRGDAESLPVAAKPAISSGPSS